MGLMTFEGSQISALVPVGGSVALSDLGTFTLHPSCTGQNCSELIDATFPILFDFNLPTLTGDPLLRSFSAVASGTVRRAGNSDNFVSSVVIDLDNTVHMLEYQTLIGWGKFGLSLNDAEIKGAGSGSTTLTGQITNLEFTRDPVTTVPEPASVGLLLGTVLALAAACLRWPVSA